jgi:hypothetical protein
MKFFTRTLFNALQDDPDLPEVIEAENAWYRACHKYQEHLHSVLPRLPKSMQEFAGTSLHDGVIRSVIQNGNELRLHIDGWSCWEPPGGSLELVFQGVKSAQGIDDVCIDDWWLYEEVHLSKLAGFEYHILLDRSECVIVADKVKLTRKDE